MWDLHYLMVACGSRAGAKIILALEIM